MKVICAGMPKTGTKSLCSALRTLGYNVYDFEEQVWFLRKDLMKAMDEGCSADEYRRMFAGVDAVTDVPACFLWEELLKAFPDAKVILTTRNNEEEWCKSALHQIKVVRSDFFVRILMTLSYTGRQLQAYGNSMVRYGLNLAPSTPLRKGPVNENGAKMRYRQHNLYVAATAPKDQFLHLNLKDGWEPLCQFLGKPIPKTPFPHRNKGGEIFGEIVNETQLFKQIRREVLLVLTLLALFLSYFLYHCYVKYI